MLLLLLLMMRLLLLVAVSAVAADSLPDPQLNQQHFRVTVIPEGFYLTAEQQPDGSHAFGGYLVDMLHIISERANFTYDLVTPSGFGSLCVPQLNSSSNSSTGGAYSDQYNLQFDCGTSDVNDMPRTDYSSDMYMGLYYITPQRQKQNYFTIPFHPPNRATPAMLGTATGIANFEHLIALQKAGQQPPACTLGSSAMVSFVQETYPDLQLKTFFGQPDDVYDAMVDHSCPIFIFHAFTAASYVYYQSLRGECLVDGQPIGVIGEPMEFGLSHLGIGVGKHLDVSVVNALSYWMNVLMVEGTLADLYKGGTGNECGYRQNPSSPHRKRLSTKAVCGVTLAAIGVLIAACTVWHRASLKRQEARYKKRFVQQIARNLQIGPRPGSIRPEKLTEEILHIGQGKDFIKKEDLARWMSDIKMDFISEKDFEALWHAMDLDDSGEVDAVEFIVFLSACGPEFEKVYSEQERMPKVERFKLAARRLSNLAHHGEDGVRQIERRLDRSSTAALKTQTSSTAGSVGN